MNELFGKKIEEMTIKLGQFFKFTCKFVNFMQIKNKWKEIFNLNDTSNDNDFYNCCEKKCINTNKVTGNCVKQNGFVNITSDINIRYINSVSGGGHDKSGRVIAENKFEKPQNCINYSLFYFEIKCQITEARNLSQSFAIIGLTDGTKRVRFITNKSLIKNEKDEEFTVTLSRGSADVYGCGLVYPPNNRMSEEFPYIFFTQNGKQIGKAVHLKENFDLVLKPFVTLKCFSVDTNFGQDLKAKPFSYDITRHFILNEFY
ncbi:unnamed protein product [Meloidogyne enterolobii]|uniref:Uncharacterized protein n=1 Tax=Meloidogyne enterolobii TaxID=390850 RepID=A0ACB0ZBF4_MELEN